MHIKQTFEKLSIEPVFVEGILGSAVQFPIKSYRGWAYKLAHGKKTNLAELGCYFSHIKAIQEFLASGQPEALIMEDDVELSNDFETVLDQALKHSERFDMLRLSGLHSGTPLQILKLDDDYNLSMFITRQTGAGAYLVNRKAANKIVKNLLPMWLPYDHAFDREWTMGFKTLCVDPLPVIQNKKFDTQIAADNSYKYPSFIRYMTVLPFRTYNELSRLVARLISYLNQSFKQKKTKVSYKSLP